MDIVNVFLLVSVVGIFSSTITSSEMETPKGPGPGVEFRTKFNIFSFFINVKEEIYCVDSEGIVVDCEMACRKPLCYMTDIFTVMILLVSVNRKLKQIWVSMMHF